MNVFADTSALLKLFLKETHSGAVRELFSDPSARPLASRITWVEALAGLARRQRMGTTTEDAIRYSRRELHRLWPFFTLVEVTSELTERAGDYSETLGLRGFDAVQLASAVELQQALAEPVRFACFDYGLNQAARVLGLEVPFAQDC